MSRIGKSAVSVPDGVTATIDGQLVSVKGPKGELAAVLCEDVTAKLGEDGIRVDPKEQTRRGRSMWGTSRSVIDNLVRGVTEGFSKQLEINGVGYRAEVKGKVLQLSLGYSHDIQYPIPEGIEIKSESPTDIVVSGIDKQKVGQVASEIRGFRPPEPYKGKGIKYVDEYVFRKEGKKK